MLAMLAAATLAAGVQAADIPAAKKPVLVELFTSEGCSSCPPADALLKSLDHEQNIPGAQVIVLSEHVDYWDHDGWRDPFSSPEVTARQEIYARRFGQDSAYTPEAVVDGAKGMVGSDRRALLGAIAEAAQRPKLKIDVASVEASNKSVQAEVKVAAHLSADLYAVVADDDDKSSVSRGENSGRHLEHVAILWWIIIGLIAGWITGKLMSGGGYDDKSSVSRGENSGRHLEHVAVLRSIQRVGSLDEGFDRQVRVDLPHGSETQKMRLLIFAEERGTGHILGVSETSV